MTKITQKHTVFTLITVWKGTLMFEIKNKPVLYQIFHAILIKYKPNTSHSNIQHSCAYKIILKGILMFEIGKRAVLHQTLHAELSKYKPNSQLHHTGTFNIYTHIHNYIY